MGKVRCGKCMFRAIPAAPYTCNYCYITGTTRKAQPAEKCRFFRAGERIEPERWAAMAAQERLRAAEDQKPKTGKPRKCDWNQARKLYDQGLSDEEIGQAIGCKRSTVCTWRKKNNLPFNPAQESPRAGQGRAGQAAEPAGKDQTMKKETVDRIRKMLREDVENRHRELDRVLVNGMDGKRELEQYREALLAREDFEGGLENAAG